MKRSNSTENLLVKLKQWYNVKQTVDGSNLKDSGIRTSFNHISHDDSKSIKSGSPLSSKNGDNKRIESESISDDIVPDENSILEKIPTKNGLIVPEKYIVLKRSLLNNVLNDHHNAYEALHKMLPSYVIKALNRGERVMPQEFDSVTIFFSDIIGFTEIAANVQPLHIVKLLNQLYSVMDHCATYFPLFKVETIGDAYMIVGGMSGDVEYDCNHASDIADFALLVQQACNLVKSPSDGSPIRLRMGIHTGPVAAGVVGNLMPRYCLFGSTVNCAHRMESTSASHQIQCSSETAKLLLMKGNHVIEKRGTIDVKGLGDMETYWLKGFTDRHVQSASFSIRETLNKCKEILDSFQNDDIGRYPHFKDKDLITIATDAIFSQYVGLNDMSEDKVAEYLETKSCNTNAIDKKDSSFVYLLNLAEVETFSETSILPATGFNALIISDTYQIRLATLYLLKETFTIDSYQVCINGHEAVTKLKILKNSFDIVIVEKNMYNNMGSHLKEEMMKLFHTRERLTIMVVPDTTALNSEDDDNDFTCVSFPFPSAKQFKSLLLQSNDSYTTKICCNTNIEPYIRHDTIFRIVMIENSIAAAKIMKKQLSAVLDDMGIAFNISVAINGPDALDKCDSKFAIDLIIVDNALPVEMQTNELLEFLRHQPKTESSLIIVLSKSALANTSELISSGADLIWPKPLPSKDELGKRLKRICKHYKFDD